MAFMLVDEQVAAVSERITGSPHVASIEIPLPDETERKDFIEHAVQAVISRPSRTMGLSNWLH